MQSNTKRCQLPSDFSGRSWRKDDSPCAWCSLEWSNRNQCLLPGYRIVRRYYELCAEVPFVTGTGQRRRVIKLRPIAHTPGRSRLATLPVLHTISSVDVTGSFANKGKLTWWKMFKDADEATIDALSKLGRRGLPTADTMAAIEKLVCRLYVPNTPIKTISELRSVRSKHNLRNYQGHYEGKLPSIDMEFRQCPFARSSSTSRVRLEVRGWSVGTHKEVFTSCARCHNWAGLVRL